MDGVRTLYHSSRVVVEYPQIRVTRYNKDFYFGFYCTELRRQADRWATRFTGRGVLNVYAYTPQDSLDVLAFPGMTEEWLDFIAACRAGVPHGHDVVEGPMADDTIFNYVQNYLDGKISRRAFWELARFKHPTHQISFHTARALAALRFVSESEVRDEE